VGKINITKKVTVFSFLVFVLIFLLVHLASARENEFGTVHAWVKLQDGEWQNASVDGVTLKVHEPFYVKVTVTTKVECHVSLEIYGPGQTVTYEVIEGPSEYNKWIDSMNCPLDWNKTYEWTVCPTGNWTEGYAPLNLFVQFTVPKDHFETEDIGIINAYISPEEWKGSTTGDTDGESSNDDNNQGQSTPGFELLIILTAIALILCWERKQTN